MLFIKKGIFFSDFTLNLDVLLDTIYWAIKSNKTTLDAIKKSMRDLIASSDGYQSTISNIYSLLPKEANWDKTIECNKECSDLKNDIQKQIFMKSLLSSLHDLKLGTFLRQVYLLHDVHCHQCSKIEQMTCLEIGNSNCNNGTVNLTSIFEKMKFAFNSATSGDVLKLQQKLSEANLTYTLSTIASGEDQVATLE